MHFMHHLVNASSICGNVNQMLFATKSHLCDTENLANMINIAY